MLMDLISISRVITDNVTVFWELDIAPHTGVSFLADSNRGTEMIVKELQQS